MSSNLLLHDFLLQSHKFRYSIQSNVNKSLCTFLDDDNTSRTISQSVDTRQSRPTRFRAISRSDSDTVNTPGEERKPAGICLAKSGEIRMM